MKTRSKKSLSKASKIPQHKQVKDKANKKRSKKQRNNFNIKEPSIGKICLRSYSNKKVCINVDKSDEPSGKAPFQNLPIKIQIIPQQLELRTGVIYQIQKDLTKKYHNLQFCPKVIVESILTTSYHPNNNYWQLPLTYPTNNYIPSFMQNNLNQKSIMEISKEEEDESRSASRKNMKRKLQEILTKNKRTLIKKTQIKNKRKK